ncbi:MAG: hypothetical protein ACRENG_27460, partial [bacterium]
MNEEYFSEIPAEAIGTRGVEYYLRVIDRNGNEQGRFPQGNTTLSVRATIKIVEQPAPPPAKTQESKKGGSKKWLFIGIGTAAVGAGAYLATQKKADEQSSTLSKLPTPPNHP